MQAVIELPTQQILEIRKIAEAKSTTESTLLQKIVHDWLMQQKAPEALHPLRESFGLWKDNTEVIDGLDYQNKLRAEWE